MEGLKQELQLGERTMLDVLNGEQELLESGLGLTNAYKDLFISYYETSISYWKFECSGP